MLIENFINATLMNFKCILYHKKGEGMKVLSFNFTIIGKFTEIS